MPEPYDNLLEATIQHLHGLKARGVRYVEVSPESLARLKRAPGGSGSPLISRPVTRPTAPLLQEATGRKPFGGNLPVPVISPVTNISATLPGASVQGLPPEDRRAAFADLRARALTCVRCAHLAGSRKNVVFGVGSIEAELMFVGEAPGADEDAQGEPFVGKAGQLLTKIIQTMGLARETVYIANILKCRPDTPGGTAGNRKPTPEEMQTCIPFLHEQIDLVRPKVLVALGATAVEGLLGKTVGITRLRGNWQTYRGIPLMPTYHPAYLLRNQALSEKRRVWEDMLQVMAKLGMDVTEKQKNYFLKG